MAAKCNITGLILQKLDELQWGLKTCAPVNKAIWEDYIAYLECPTVNSPNCYPAADCPEELVEVVCRTSIHKLSVSVDGDMLIFTVLPSDMVGFTEPFTYGWSYDQKVFTASGPVNDYQLKLLLKGGIDMTTIVARVGVVITDVHGCTASKFCYFTPVGLQCNVNYTPCVNASSLRVTNTLTQCVGPSGLIITKI